MTNLPRIVIVGLGSIGLRHADTLISMGYTDLAGIDVRPFPHEERFPVISAFCDLGSWQPTHAMICSPPDWHYHHAKYFIERGIPTFIEKPMTVSTFEASALCATAHMNRSVLAVGYMERAHPAVWEAQAFTAMHGCEQAEICCYWRSAQKTYRLDTVSESSHAIDLALYLFGTGRVVEKKVQGSEVTLHTAHERGTACTIRMNMNEWPRRVINLRSATGKQYSALYGDTRQEWDACYQEELQAFLDGSPLCTGEDGLYVMTMLEEIQLA